MTKKTWAVGGYMLCSATLLIGNKYAVSRVPAPSFILWAQMFGTTVTVKAAHVAGLIESLDALQWDKAVAFLPVALIFVATIFTNMKSLEYANVETPRPGVRRVDGPSLALGDRGRNARAAVRDPRFRPQVHGVPLLDAAVHQHV